MEDYDKQRVQKIHAMILEMATGNFQYRIERSSRDDELESIVVGLNMLAEEIEANIVHQGFANINRPIIDLVKIIFIVDKNGVIEVANSQAGKMLAQSMDGIVGKAFEDFLTDGSKSLWKNKWKGKTNRLKLKSRLQLVFKLKNGFEAPKVVHLTAFKERTSKNIRILVTIIHHSNYQNKLKSALKKRVITGKHQRENLLNDPDATYPENKVILTFDDIQKIRTAYDLIVSNPQNNFPTQKDFALQLGTNEFKLKYGFKELYGLPIHDFIIQERLRMAQILIQYSDLYFKNIAHQSGFKSQSHFSRIFKEKFGYTPKELRKNTVSLRKL